MIFVFFSLLNRLGSRSIHQSLVKGRNFGVPDMVIRDELAVHKIQGCFGKHRQGITHYIGVVGVRILQK